MSASSPSVRPCSPPLPGGRTVARSRARSFGTRTCARGTCAEVPSSSRHQLGSHDECEGTAHGPVARTTTVAEPLCGPGTLLPRLDPLRLRDGPDRLPTPPPPRVGRVTSSNGEPLVRMSGVNKWFGELHVLQDIDLQIARGEVVVVIGPSGSGKSTLCRTINRLESIEKGEIAIDGVTLPEEGKELARLRSDVGMVFQTSTCSRTRRSCRTSPSARSRSAGRRGPRRRSAPGNCSSGSGSPHRPTSTRPSCPAASSSASPSRGPWRWTRRSCCSTSRRQPSTPR